jgi:hypothetical protein
MMQSIPSMPANFVQPNVVSAVAVGRSKAGLRIGAGNATQYPSFLSHGAL